MCGICGFTHRLPLSYTQKQPSLSSEHAGSEQEGAQEILQSMCDIIAHRGPDGQGSYIDEGIALGHRRLSLIDLEGGSQPLIKTHQNKQFVIVFNGEIYNYQDLRKELVALGYNFETHSDTEVLLCAWLAWKEGCLTRLRGMFAFALWDKEAQELVCARDFFGIKPFYYTVVDGQFIFASEIKAILEHPAYERKLNHEALEQYLMFQFSALDETFFKGIYKLKPGHCLRFKVPSQELIQESYWAPHFGTKTTNTLSANNNLANAASEELADKIDTLLMESVRYHNVADVEVGSFLSSGIDSSYMAACLAQENPSIQTFTVGFAQYQHERDEISWAKELAATLGVTNRSHHITEEEYWASLERVQWHMDEPSADPSAVALYFVDALASKHVKAVLSGEGADEFFGGYKIYQAPLSNSKLAWIPKPLLKTGSSVLKALNIRGSQYLDRASKTVADWYYTNANAVAFSYDEACQVLKTRPTNKPQDITRSTYHAVQDLDQISQMQYLDLHFWLVGDILLKTDKMSMAHSLESRVPFLDKHVFDFASTLPLNCKLNSEQTKIALRMASNKRIPSSWAQKEKLGFPVPLADWLRQDCYAKKIKKLFTSNVAQEFFDQEYCLNLLEEHKQGADRSRKIWIIAMFILWYQIYFVDKRVPTKPEFELVEC